MLKSWALGQNINMAIDCDNYNIRYDYGFPGTRYNIYCNNGTHEHEQVAVMCVIKKH